MDDDHALRESRSGPTLACSTDAVILREPPSLPPYARTTSQGIGRIEVVLPAPPRAPPLRRAPSGTTYLVAREEPNEREEEEGDDDGSDASAPSYGVERRRRTRRAPTVTRGEQAPVRVASPPLDVWQLSVAFAFGVLAATLARALGGATDLGLAILATSFAGCTSVVAAVVRGRPLK